MYTHVHTVFLTSRHDSLEEILHVGSQLSLVDTLIEIEELAELLNRSLVVLAEVSAYESLSLDDNVLHQLVILLRSHRLCQLVALFDNAAAFAPALWELELLPFLTCALALKDIDVEICEFGIVEIQIRRTVWISMEQVCTRPVQYWHEVIADAVYALGREVAQTLLIDLNLMVSVRTAIFNCLNYRQTLYHAPAHAVALDILTQVTDLLTCPYFT